MSLANPSGVATGEALRAALKVTNPLVTITLPNLPNPSGITGYDLNLQAVVVSALEEPLTRRRRHIGAGHVPPPKCLIKQLSELEPVTESNMSPRAPAP